MIILFFSSFFLSQCIIVMVTMIRDLEQNYDNTIGKLRENVLLKLSSSAGSFMKSIPQNQKYDTSFSKQQQLSILFCGVKYETHTRFGIGTFMEFYTGFVQQISWMYVQYLYRIGRWDHFEKWYK